MACWGSFKGRKLELWISGPPSSGNLRGCQGLLALSPPTLGSYWALSSPHLWKDCCGHQG